MVPARYIGAPHSPIPRPPSTARDSHSSRNCRRYCQIAGAHHIPISIATNSQRATAIDTGGKIPAMARARSIFVQKQAGEINSIPTAILSLVCSDKEDIIIYILPLVRDGFRAGTANWVLTSRPVLTDRSQPATTGI